MLQPVQFSKRYVLLKDPSSHFGQMRKLLSRLCCRSCTKESLCKKYSQQSRFWNVTLEFSSLSKRKWAYCSAVEVTRRYKGRPLHLLLIQWSKIQYPSNWQCFDSLSLSDKLWKNMTTKCLFLCTLHNSHIANAGRCLRPILPWFALTSPAFS